MDNQTEDWSELDLEELMPLSQEFFMGRFNDQETLMASLEQKYRVAMEALETIRVHGGSVDRNTAISVESLDPEGFAAAGLKTNQFSKFPTQTKAPELKELLVAQRRQEFATKVKQALTNMLGIIDKLRAVAVKTDEVRRVRMVPEQDVKALVATSRMLSHSRWREHEGNVEFGQFAELYDTRLNTAIAEMAKRHQSALAYDIMCGERGFDEVLDRFSETQAVDLIRLRMRTLSTLLGKVGSGEDSIYALDDGNSIGKVRYLDEIAENFGLDTECRPMESVAIFTTALREASQEKKPDVKPNMDHGMIVNAEENSEVLAYRSLAIAEYDGLKAIVESMLMSIDNSYAVQCWFRADEEGNVREGNSYRFIYKLKLYTEHLVAIGLMSTHYYFAMLHMADLYKRYYKAIFTAASHPDLVAGVSKWSNYVDEYEAEKKRQRDAKQNDQ